MIDLFNCDFVVWGCRRVYNTFGHIFEAFEHALKFRFPERNVRWLDSGDNLTEINFENTFFISVDVARIDGLPRHKNSFYAVHNVDKKFRDYLEGYDLLNYGVYSSKTDLGSHTLQLGEEAFYSRQEWEQYASVMFRWATNLLPNEVRANKPNHVFNQNSRVINYVGSRGGIYDENLIPFGEAAWSEGILLRTVGGYGNSHLPGISNEENVRLIKESYMAPALCPLVQNQIGYIPCRLFKNLSYGQYPVTNSWAAQELFKGRLIYNPDPRQLFFDAKDMLPGISVEELHILMDEVAAKHTYLNRLDALLAAARQMLQERH
jgi:hypothetical protein